MALLTRTVSENVAGITGDATRTQTLRRVLPQTVTPTSSITRTVGAERTIAEAPGVVTNTITAGFFYVRTVDEEIDEPTEEAERTLIIVRAPAAGTATPTDAATRSGTFARTIAETVTPIGIVTRSVAIARTVAESPGAVTATDLGSAQTKVRLIVESIASATMVAQRTSITYHRAMTEGGEATSVITRAVTFPRTIDEEIDEPTSSAAPSKTLNRSVAESAPAVESAARSMQSMRSTFDSAAVGTSIARRTRQLVRSIGQSLTTVDAWVRHSSTRRTVAESAPASNTVGRQLTLGRALTEALTTTDEITRQYDISGGWDEDLSDQVDEITSLTSDLTRHPLVEIEEESIAKLGPLQEESEIQMRFDPPCTRWVIRIGGTCPFDGTLADSYEGEPVSSDSGVVHRSHLVRGDNDVRVYAMTEPGVWSFRQVFYSGIQHE
jgi:hypothetical protein